MVDSLLSVTGVTAQGEVITANSTSNPDLLWAVKGGGPNYLLLTSLTFKTHRAPSQVSYLKFTAPKSSMKQFLAAYVDWQPWDLPVEYAMVEAVLASAQDSWLDIFYWGSLDKLMLGFSVSPLAKVPGGRVAASSVNTWGEALTKITGQPLSSMGATATLSNQYTGDNTDTGTRPPRDTGAKAFKASSLMFNAPLSPKAQEALVTAVTQAPDAEPSGSWIIVQLKALGGPLLTSISEESAALPHRDVLLEGQVYSDNLDMGAMQRMVRKVKGAMVPFMQGHPFYYNHLDCDDLAGADGHDAWAVYFGDSAKRLIAVKQKYDPEQRFNALRCSTTRA
jgi:hypothetical protein